MVPSIKSTRKKWLPWLAIPAAAAAIILPYRLNHPPELVWWTSPALSDSGQHIRMKIPSDWKALDSASKPVMKNGVWTNKTMILMAVDHRPSFLWNLRLGPEYAVLIIFINSPVPHPKDNISVFHSPYNHTAVHEVTSKDGRVTVQIQYGRENVRAFNRNYKQICNSLRIE